MAGGVQGRDGGAQREGLADADFPRVMTLLRLPAGVSSGRYRAGMAVFAMTLVHGPGWDPDVPIREQRAWPEHAAFMDSLVADGMIIIGGPLSEGGRTLHAVAAASESEVRARIAADPWAVLGLLRIGSLEPWALWLDSRQP